jgi:hypothetical protein
MIQEKSTFHIAVLSKIIYVPFDPFLEISRLPFGKPLITLEGRLIEQSIRTASGTLLVELPAQIDRAVTVNVRIEE